MRARVLAPPTRRRLASGVCVRFLSNGVPRPSHPLAHLINEIERFSPSCDVSEALTAPSSWYTDAEFLELEKLSVFHDAWLHVGHIGQVRTPGQFFSGNVVGEPFIVVRGENDLLHAHFNVCAHHAMPVAPASGTLDLTCRRGGSEFVCPYHGWRYKCDGRLRQATQVKGIKNFRVKNYGLTPIHVDTIGQLVFVNFSPTALAGEPPPLSLADWCGPLVETMSVAAGTSGLEKRDNLVHVARRTYEIDCNWKVFCDNYCDGGYHVPFAHGALAKGIDMSTYATEHFERLSVQTVGRSSSTVGETPNSTETVSDDSAEKSLPSGGDYLAAMVRESKAEGALAAAFAKLDADGDGFITAGDLHYQLRTLAASGAVDDTTVCDASVAQIIKRTDTDSNGKISFAEFARFPNTLVSKSPSRLGDGAAYAFLYPNVMLNRYGPWLDTNTVVPHATDPGKCSVRFDYFVEKDLAGEEKYIADSMAASEQVQEEDHALCIGVQQGLTSRAYGQGRYVPQFEQPMHHFHSQLFWDYRAELSRAVSASSSAASLEVEQRLGEKGHASRR